MTEELKQKFEKQFEKWLRKYLLCNNCKRKCTCVQLNAYCEEQVRQAYIAGATEETRELKRELEEERFVTADLKKWIERMKRCEICANSGDWRNRSKCIACEKSKSHINFELRR